MLWSNSSFCTDICWLTSISWMILWRYDGCLLKWCSVSVDTRWPVRCLSSSQVGKQTSPSVRLPWDKKSDNKNDKVCKALLKSSKQLITHKGSVTQLRECFYHREKAFSHDGICLQSQPTFWKLEAHLVSSRKENKATPSRHSVSPRFLCLHNEAEISHAPKEEHGVTCSRLWSRVSVAL